MELTIGEVAKLLNASEKQVNQWAQSGVIPSYGLQGELLFNRDEVIEWAAVKHVSTCIEKLDNNSASNKPQPIFLKALKRGKVLYNVPGNSREEVLRELSQLLPFPDDCDRELVYRMFLARENCDSTGIGDGIALPHVKNPLVLHVTEPQVSIAFLKNKIDFYAYDRKPVYCLFSIVSTSVKEHIQLLSHISNVLGKREFIGLLQNRETEGKIIKFIENAETST
ncbi:MAG: PTS sugar transporter subunit IIA [Candidatus Riflebacteria bacterium]|nr:PTS sugar transporter subunit IIA [Candidatus Riflebacteria bacterium]